MRNAFLAIVAIKQIDNHTFQIHWNDGSTKNYRLSALQRLCPCANCIDESTGERLVSPADVDEHVKAISIRSVGRYALAIAFDGGCSKGIYPFTMLHSV